jgi:hypothetical protein
LSKTNQSNIDDNSYTINTNSLAILSVQSQKHVLPPRQAKQYGKGPHGRLLAFRAITGAWLCHQNENGTVAWKSGIAGTQRTQG